MRRDGTMKQDGMAPSRTIRVGTRSSQLARTQTGWVVERMRRLGLVVEVEMISTQGDARTDVPIAGIGGDGVFVRELERALLDGRIDAAVHSYKDMPTAVTPGLTVTCVPERATAFDVLVGRTATSLEALPPGAGVGTSSIRRIMQVRAARGDLEVRPIRGNVDTRLRKLDAGEYDCLVLAGAGLERLGLGGRVTQVLQPPAFWPAIAQGALAIQIRSADAELATLLAAMDDPPTHAAVVAERSCLATLAGGCLAPIAGWARVEAGRLVLGARVFGEDAGGIVCLHAEEAAAMPGHGTAESAADLGRLVAERLMSQGADEVLERVRRLSAE
jgi:hydroxymethylbilane synthase